MCRIGGKKRGLLFLLLFFIICGIHIVFSSHSQHSFIFLIPSLLFIHSSSPFDGHFSSSGSIFSPGPARASVDASQKGVRHHAETCCPMHHRLSSLNRARYAIKRGTSSVHQRRVYIYSYSTLSIDAVHDSYIVGRTYILDTFPFFPLLSHSFSHKYTAATNIVRRSALDIIYLFFLSFFSSFFVVPFLFFVSFFFAIIDERKTLWRQLPSPQSPQSMAPYIGVYYSHRFHQKVVAFCPESTSPPLSSLAVRLVADHNRGFLLSYSFFL